MTLNVTESLGGRAQLWPTENQQKQKESLGMKGDVELWFKAGQTEEKPSREWKLREKMQTWLNLSPNGCSHSHDTLKGESGSRSQQAASVRPVTCRLLVYPDAQLAGEVWEGQVKHMFTTRSPFGFNNKQDRASLYGYSAASCKRLPRCKILF